MGFTLPPPNLGPSNADRFAMGVLALLKTRQNQQEIRNQHEQALEEMALRKEKFALEAKQIQHQMDLADMVAKRAGLNAEEDNAQKAFNFLQGAPGPVGDISQGVSSIQGLPKFALDHALAQATQQAPDMGDLRTGPAPMPMDGGRADMSQAQPVGRLPEVLFPLINGGTLARRPLTDTELRKQTAQTTADANALTLQKVAAEAEARAVATERHRAPVREPQPTTASVALAAAQGDPIAKKAMQDLRPGSASNPGSQDDANAIADAIIRGEQPPTTAGLYRFGAPVKAALAKKGFNLTDANLDWEATKRHLASMNGVKQTTLRQAAQTAYDSLDIIDGIAEKWNTLTSPLGGRLPALNKATLSVAKGGLLGKEASALATELEGQITDVVSELGQVYMGGNSPTDHALKLAEKNLNAGWSEGTLKRMTDLARKNLQVRINSMNHSGVAGTTGGAAPDPMSQAQDYAEGTVLQNASGAKIKLVNGQWVPVK